jgi:hypothetical protein
MRNLRRIKSWGLVLAAIWLILMGVFSLLKGSFSGEGLILDLLAIAAGVLILLGR